MRNRAVLAIFVLSLVVGSFLRGRDLLLPYENGHRGSTAAFFALMAKNHLRYGFLTTGGVGVLNPVKVDREHFHYYLHHPPGTIWIATVGAALGGTNPYGLRLVFLPFSIGIILLVYRLGRSRSRKNAAIAAAIAAMVPIATYYGAFVNFELPTLFFSLLTLHLYERFRSRGRRQDQTRCMVAFAAAVFCDWIALGIPFCLWILAGRSGADDPSISPDDAARAVRKSRRLARKLLVTGVGVVVAVKVLYSIQISRFGVDPTSASGFGYYLQATPLATTFDPAAFVRQLGEYLATWYGHAQLGTGERAWSVSPLLLLAAIGLVMALARFIKGRLDGLDTAAITILALGSANLAILANHATGHNYYVFYLFPGVALLASSLIGRLPSHGKAWPALPIALIALLGHLYEQGEAAHEGRTQTLLSDTGKRIKSHTAQEAVVILPHYYTLQVGVTANRLILNAATSGELDQVMQYAIELGHEGRPVVFLVDRASAAGLDAGLKQALEARSAGPATERGPFLAYDLGIL